VLAEDFDRIRLLLGEAPRGRDQDVPVLPSRRQVITALEAIDFPDAMRKAGMTVLPLARPSHTITDAEALVLAVEHRGALPTSAELTAFCKANGISRDSRKRPPYAQVLEQARAIAADRGITVPDDFPPLDDRPPWHEPVETLEKGGAARRWSPGAILEVLDDFPDWLTSPEGPADRAFSHGNLAACLDLGTSRPGITVVYEHLGGLVEITAAVLDRHTTRDGEAPPDDVAAPAPAADDGPQPQLEQLLNEHAGPTLPAILRYAQTTDTFVRGDLAFLGVSDVQLRRLLTDLVEAEALKVTVPAAATAGATASPARCLSARNATSPRHRRSTTRSGSSGWPSGPGATGCWPPTSSPARCRRGSPPPTTPSTSTRATPRQASCCESSSNSAASPAARTPGH
jgi:hypothetical protein